VIRRAIPQSKIDEHRFRCRVRFERPGTGLWDVHKYVHAWLDARLGKDNYAFHPDTWDGHGLEAHALHFDDYTIIPDLMKHYDAIVTVAHRTPKFWATVARADVRVLRDAIFHIQQTITERLNADEVKVTWTLGVCSVRYGVEMKLGDVARLREVFALTEIDTLLSRSPPLDESFIVELEDGQRGSLETGLGLLQDLRPAPEEHISVLRAFLDTVTVIADQR
jgi:hypothetical protein